MACVKLRVRNPLSVVDGDYPLVYRLAGKTVCTEYCLEEVLLQKLPYRSKVTSLALKMQERSLNWYSQMMRKGENYLGEEW